jgi:hypothetical protein
VLLALDLEHFGLPGEADLALNAFAAELVRAGDETPLSAPEIEALASRVSLYLDDGSDRYEPGFDRLVLADAIRLDEGRIVLDLAAAGGALHLAPGQRYRLFLVLEFTPTAVQQHPDEFRARLVPFTDATLRLADGQDTRFAPPDPAPWTHLQVTSPPVVPFHEREDREVAAFSDYTGAISLAEMVDLGADGDIDVLAAAPAFALPGGGALAAIGWIEDLGYSFAAPVLAGAMQDPVALAAADIDRDGDDDVLAASGTEPAVRWFENGQPEAIGWRAHTVTADFLGGTSARLADLDQDGDADVLGVKDAGGTIVWWANDGSGAGWEVRSVTTIVGACDVAAGDLDGDGDPDIAVACRDPGQILWLRNEGGALAWTEATVDADFAGAAGVRLADLDGDGALDVVALSPLLGDLCWWRNPGAGDSRDVPPWAKHVIVGNISGFTYVNTLDVNFDGDADVGAGSPGEPFRFAFWRNTLAHGNARFPAAQTLAAGSGQATAAVCADVDRDGLREVLVADAASGQLTGWRLSSPGTWESSPVATAVPALDSLLAADVDLDGDLDLLGTERLGPSFSWWEDRLPEAWVAHPDAGAANGPLAGARLCDLDHDGDPDLVAAEWGAASLAWWANPRGPGAWPRQSLDDAFPGAEAVGWADVDGDGRRDLFSASPVLGQVAWWGYTAGRGWDRHVFAEGLPGVRSACVFRAQAELPTLLALARYPDSQEPVRLLRWRQWFNWATDALAWVGPSQVWATTGSDPRSLVPVDLDGDTTPELLARHVEAEAPVWLDSINQASSWEAHLLITPGSRQTAAASADLDGDGRRDLVLAGQNGTRLELWPNRGGQFGLVTLDLAPPAVGPGDRCPVFHLDACHRGLSDEDDALYLTHLVLLFEEQPGRPLTSAEANGLFAAISVWADDGSGVFDAADMAGAPLAQVAPLALEAGRLAVQLPGGSTGADVAAAGQRTFFVTVDLATYAGAPPLGQFRVTHCTDSGSTGARDGTPTVSGAVNVVGNVPLRLEYTPDVSTRLVQVVSPTGPQVAFTAPTAGPDCASDGLPMVIAGTAVGQAAPVAAVTYVFQGGREAEGTATGTVAWSLPATRFTGPDTQVYAIARDQAGNTGAARLNVIGYPGVAFAAASSAADEVAGTLRIPVLVDRVPDVALSVECVVVGGSASGDGTDAALTATTLTFAPGQTIAFATVEVTNDDQAEAVETLELALRDPSGAVLTSPDRHALALADEDLDFDSLSDDWERSHQGDLAYDGNRDTDGDGLRDGDELRAGTDPYGYTITLRPGWNLFSIAAAPEYDLLGSREAGAIPPPVWGWQGEAYRRVTSVSPVAGHWLFRPEPDELAVTIAVPAPAPGAPLPADPPLVLQPGWNLISVPRVLEDPRVASVLHEVLAEIAPGLWGWDGVRYVPATEFSPFTGCWLFHRGQTPRTIDLPVGPSLP